MATVADLRRCRVLEVCVGLAVLAGLVVAGPEPAGADANNSPCATDNDTGPNQSGSDVTATGDMDCTGDGTHVDFLEIRIQEQFGTWMTRSQNSISPSAGTIAVLNLGSVASCAGHGLDNWRAWVRGIDTSGRVDIDSVPVKAINC